MDYDITLLTSSGDLVGILQAFNVYSNGWFGILFCLVFPLIIFSVVSQMSGMKESLLSSSIVLFISSLCFLLMDLIKTEVFWIFMFITLISLIMAKQQ